MESDFKEFPKGVAPTDFWKQVKRTVGGQPVSEEQIALIVSVIKQALMLENDVLLDLACGNGALSSYLYDDCVEFVGVDFSEVLIDVARQHFQRPQAGFLLADVGKYIVAEAKPARFTKVLCYGSFAYFTESDARLVLTSLHDQFVNVSKVFIGNLPDLDRQADFFTDGLDHTSELKDPESKIGTWRTEAEFCELAADCGWSAQIQRMPEQFYAAHYRYDALLTRQA